MQAYYFLEPMNDARVQQLMQYVKDEPNDPFNMYALAMEFMSERPEQARVYFEQLLINHPEYLPTYYHAAALYTSLDERDKAAELYDKGIELAQKQRNTKMFQELTRAQQAFEDDEDDW